MHRKILPGDPYEYKGKLNPYKNLLGQRQLLMDTNNKNKAIEFVPKHDATFHIDGKDKTTGYDFTVANEDSLYHEKLWRETSSVEVADAEDWVVSVTPKRRMVACLYCRQYRYWYESADAKFCIGFYFISL